MTETVSQPRHAAAPPNQRRAVLSASAGTVVEGYDWILYSTFAAIIAPRLFFSQADPLAATLGALLTLAVAFVARPVGMVIFGGLADRYGRRPVLIGTIALMGAATLAIAAAPTYDQVGALAAVVLVAARFVQGMAYAGEWAPATLVASEDAPRRGRAAASVPASLTAGSVLATTVLLILTTSVSQEELLAWAWRIPFVIGAVLALAVLVLRSTVPETDAFEDARARGELLRRPVWTAVRQHHGVISLLMLVTAAQSAAFYTVLILGQSWGVQLGYSRAEVTLAVLVLSVSMVVVVLISGRLADRFGPRRVAVVGLWATLASAAPWALLVGTGSAPAALLGAALLGGACVIPFAVTGPLAGPFFSPALRASGMSLGFQLGSVLGGGAVPIVATALFGATGSIGPVVALIIAVQVVALFALRRLGPIPEWTS